MHGHLEQRVSVHALPDLQLSKHVGVPQNACFGWCSELMLVTGTIDSAAQERHASEWQSSSSVDSLWGVWHPP
jgi:hypothetical protein